MIDDRPEKLSAHEVAVWLRRHPNFLGQFPDLALSLVVPREEGKTAALSSYQLEILRDKNKELNRRLHELSLNAQDNEKLTHNIHELCLALLRARKPADVVHSLVACLKEDFASESVRVISFVAIEGIDEEWFSFVQDLPIPDRGGQGVIFVRWRRVLWRCAGQQGLPVCGQRHQRLLGRGPKLRQRLAQLRLRTRAIRHHCQMRLQDPLPRWQGAQ